jgi:hypothetical protein
LTADRPHLAVLLELLGDDHAQVGHGDAGGSEPELPDAMWF